MLLNYVKIVNVDGTHTFNLNDVTSPLSDFDVTVDDRSDAKRYKPQLPGSWPTRSYDGPQTIHMEGVLFDVDSASCLTSRKALILALRGVPETPVVQERRGRISFQPASESEYWYADFGSTDISMPLKGDFPALINYMISVEVFLPYFIGESSGNLYQWS